MPGSAAATLDKRVRLGDVASPPNAAEHTNPTTRQTPSLKAFPPATISHIYAG
jgi:hypothetical protein